MRALALVLVAGCRSILGIEDVTGDKVAANDEDLDGRVDLDDNCPTVDNPGQADGDGDGVGNECDPDPVAVNRIAFFSSMIDDRGISTPIQFGDGFAILDGFPLSLAEEHKPVRVEAAVIFNGFDASESIGIEIDVGAALQWTCFAVQRAPACGNIDCVQLKLPAQSPVSAAYPRTSLISKLVLDTRPTGAATCTLIAEPEEKSTSSQGQIVSTGFVRVVSTDARLFSLVVYE